MLAGLEEPLYNTNFSKFSFRVLSSLFLGGPRWPACLSLTSIFLNTHSVIHSAWAVKCDRARTSGGWVGAGWLGVCFIVFGVLISVMSLSHMLMIQTITGCKWWIWMVYTTWLFLQINLAFRSSAHHFYLPFHLFWSCKIHCSSGYNLHFRSASMLLVTELMNWYWICMRLWCRRNEIETEDLGYT